MASTSFALDVLSSLGCSVSSWWPSLCPPICGTTAVLRVLPEVTLDRGRRSDDPAVAGVTTTTALAYGVIDICAFVSTNGESMWTEDSGWSCSKWEDNKTTGWEDCKKAATNGLAFGLIGLFATIPAAAICLLSCFCEVRNNKCGKCFTWIAIVCLAAATIAFMIAPAVLANECDDANKSTAYTVRPHWLRSALELCGVGV